MGYAYPHSGRATVSYVDDMVSAASAPWVDLVFRGRRLARDRALVMAVIDEAVIDDAPSWREAIGTAVEQGADLIDVGDDRELVEWARETFPDLAISVRTERGERAERACLAGADVLNDGWGRADSGVLDAAARYGAGYLGAVDADGLPRGALVRVAADLTALGELVDGGRPVLFDLAELSSRGEDRLAEVVASAALAARAGAAIVRAREVRATRHAVEMVASIVGTRPPSRPERWLA